MGFQETQGFLEKMGRWRRLPSISAPGTPALPEEGKEGVLRFPWPFPGSPQDRDSKLTTGGVWEGPWEGTQGSWLLLRQREEPLVTVRGSGSYGTSAWG